MNKKLFAFLILSVFMLSFASASISYEENNQTYTINTWIPDWMGGDGTSTVTLLDNTDHCLINCGFHLSGYNEQELNLVDDINFNNYKGQDISNQLKELNFKLGTYQEVEKYNTTYETVCEEVFLNNTNSTNSTNLTKQCHQELVSNETYYVNELIWEDYDNQKVSGYWELKANAKKNPVSMDWIITFRDKELSEWAWWNSDWKYKRQINLAASVGKFSYIERINYSSGMQTDFDDIRFLNSDEDEELNFTIEKKVDSSYMVVRIFSQGASSVYMYYGNDLATSTSSASDTHFNPVSMYYFDGDAKDAVGSNNGIIYGATYTSAGKINGAYSFDGSNDYISLPKNLYDLGVVSTGSVNFWAYVDVSDTADNPLFADIDDGSTGMNIRQHLGTGMTVYAYDDGTELARVNIASCFSSSGWYMISWIMTNNKFYVYVNNDLKSTTTLTGNLGDSAKTVLLAKRPDLSRYTECKIDEVGIWSRALTATEVSYLYQYTAPTYTIEDEEQSTGIDINYVSPPTPLNESHWNKTYLPIKVNISYNNVDFKNITYELTNSNVTDITFTNETYEYNFTGLVTDDYYFNVTVCGIKQSDNTTICESTETRHIYEDALPPRINLTSPTGTYDYLQEGQDFYLVGTETDENLDTCWYEYNSTNKTFSCSSGIQFNETFQLNDEENTIKVYVNDTFGNVGSKTTSWNYLIFSSNVTYNQNTIETSEEEFSISLKSDEELEVNLVYDNINYPATSSILPNSTLYSSTIDIPLVSNDENITFYWNIKDSVEINTTERIQLVKDFKYDFDETYNYLNISIYDEKTGLYIDNTTLQILTDYYIGSGNIKENVFNSQIKSEPFLLGSNLQTDFITKNEFIYQADGYQPRDYLEDLILINESITKLELYLLGNSDGTTQLFHISEALNLQDISNVKIRAERKVGNDFFFADSIYSDDGGNGNLWLNPDEIHEITFSKEGCETKSIQIYPTGVRIEEISMNCGGIIEGPTYNSSDFLKQKGILASFSPGIKEITYSLNNESQHVKQFNVTYEDLDNNMTGAEFKLINTSNNIILASTTSLLTKDTLTINYNVTSSKNIKAYLIINKNSETLTYQKIYEFINSDLLIYDGSSLYRIFTKLKDIGDFGLSQKTKTFIAFIVLFLLLGFLSLSGVIKSEGYSLYLIIAAYMFLFSWLGWFTLDLPLTMANQVIQNNLNQYALFLLSILTISGILISQTQD